MRRRTEALLWLVTIALLAGTAIGFSRGRPLAPLTGGARADGPESMPPAAESLGTWVLRVVQQDPFRLARVPSRIPYGSTAEASQVLAASIALPPLRLSGIVGPPWRAVLDGANLDAGRVVAPGDSVAGAVVRSVRRESVTLRLGDTTWTLSLARP